MKRTEEHLEKLFDISSRRCKLPVLTTTMLILGLEFVLLFYLFKPHHLIFSTGKVKRTEEHLEKLFDISSRRCKLPVLTTTMLILGLEFVLLFYLFNFNSYILFMNFINGIFF